MRETRILMGMPVTVEIVDATASQDAINKVFEYFVYVDDKFSTYKTTSEITKINDGLLKLENASQDMKEVFLLCDKTKEETNGYFDIVNRDGKLDPSGLVKGWAIYNASELLKKLDFKNFYIEAGGDIQVQGCNGEGKAWKVGIKNPFNVKEVIKVVHLKNNEGIATSGSYERGNHIYNPKNKQDQLAEIVSLTVIGKNIYEADRFTTAAFAMQREGINFIEKLPDFEGYMVDKTGIATMTSGFSAHTFL